MAREENAMEQKARSGDAKAEEMRVSRVSIPSHDITSASRKGAAEAALVQKASEMTYLAVRDASAFSNAGTGCDDRSIKDLMESVAGSDSA